MTKLFRNNPDAAKLHSGIKAYYLGRDQYDAILGQPGCTGIRSYHGNNPDLSPQIIVVGVDAKNNDMVDGYLADGTYPCPAICSADGTLT